MEKWRHLWVGLFTLFCALSLFGEAGDYASHFTSQGLENVTSLLDLEAAYLKRLERISGTELSEAEQSSLRHQNDVLSSVQGNLKVVLENEGFLTKAYVKGVVDSDLGKLSEFKKLLTTKSTKSDSLLNFLKNQGSKKSKKVLNEILERFPVKQRALLNPSLTNEQIRMVFKKNPVLQHYLHELVGIADPLYFFNNNTLTEKSFKDQLKTNLFHNGPHAGFWKFYTEVTIFGLVGKDPNAKKFFLNTVYEGKKESNGFISPKYPGPLSFEGYVHVVFDRLSQGTRGGVEKIFEEIRHFPGQSDVEKMASLLFDNPRSTQEQLIALIELANEDPELNSKQQKILVELIENSQKRLDGYISFVAKNIEFKIEGSDPVLILKLSDSEKVVFKTAGDKLSIAKSGKEPRTSDPKSFGNEIKNQVVELLLKEEALNGNLLKTD